MSFKAKLKNHKYQKLKGVSYLSGCAPAVVIHTEIVEKGSNVASNHKSKALGSIALESSREFEREIVECHGFLHWWLHIREACALKRRGEE